MRGLKAYTALKQNPGVLGSRAKEDLPIGLARGGRWVMATEAQLLLPARTPLLLLRSALGGRPDRAQPPGLPSRREEGDASQTLETFKRQNPPGIWIPVRGETHTRTGYQTGLAHGRELNVLIRPTNPWSTFDLNRTGSAAVVVRSWSLT